METELKIEVPDLAAVRSRLEEAGATLISVVDENNLYFDRKDKLSERRESLRVRDDGRVRLTWKGPGGFDKGILERPEIEIEVSSFDQTVELLERLEFEPIDRLLKKRETWRLNGVDVALDTLHFGTFVEIEGSTETVRAVASQLGLDLKYGLRDSYRQLRRARDPNSWG